MAKFKIEFWLDGYETKEEMIEACKEYIYEALNFSASSVGKIEYIKEDD